MHLVVFFFCESGKSEPKTMRPLPEATKCVKAMTWNVYGLKGIVEVRELLFSAACPKRKLGCLVLAGDIKVFLHDLLWL